MSQPRNPHSRRRSRSPHSPSPRSPPAKATTTRCRPMRATPTSSSNRPFFGDPAALATVAQAFVDAAPESIADDAATIVKPSRRGRGPGGDGDPRGQHRPPGRRRRRSTTTATPTRSSTSRVSTTPSRTSPTRSTPAVSRSVSATTPAPRSRTSSFIATGADGQSAADLAGAADRSAVPAGSPAGGRLHRRTRPRTPRRSSISNRVSTS